jgi:peptidoglycan/xylan/chitin deacetylase (PgdA/CDA1 family)
MLRSVKGLSVLLAFLFGVAEARAAADCADDPRTTGLARTIAVDSTGGKQFGRLQYSDTAPLRAKEIVLTFDDGPHPLYTKLILDTLDKHCVKATFFTVGRMSIFAPKILKSIARRGHTIATHTWSHPRDLSKMPVEEAKLEIEKGFAATAYALGEPIAPFFRYPGLNDSPDLNAYLATRDISVWSVDVVSGDTEPGNTPDTLLHNTLERVRKMGRGVVLFHDLKSITVDMLDAFLSILKGEGYKFVHVVSNASYKPNQELVARLDFSKEPLQNVAFTGVVQPGNGSALVLGQNGLKPGEVDIMKTEFLHIEASSLAAKQELAEQRASAKAVKAPPQRSASPQQDNRTRLD